MTSPTQQRRRAFTPDEVGERGEALYESKIRAQVETDENIGKLIWIDILSGDDAIGEDHLETGLRLKATRPDAEMLTLRTGYPAAFSRGFRMLPSPPR